MNLRLHRLDACRQLMLRQADRETDTAAFQARQLRRLVKHSYENVPYYGRLFDDNGIHPDDVRSLADIVRIPATSKYDLQQQQMEDITSGDSKGRGTQHLATSGTTGAVSVVRRTWFEQKLLTGFRLVAMRDHGLRKNSRVVVIGIPPKNGKNHFAGMHGILNALLPFRFFRVSVFQAPEKILEELLSIRPDIIMGYPGVFVRLGQLMDENVRNDLHPETILTSGEMLTPVVRNSISRDFNTTVLDNYCSYEFNLIGWECTRTGLYHVCDDCVIVEILKDGKPVREGESGEVVVTALHSFFMPRIRFRLEDIAVRGPDQCDCGAGCSTISEINGRTVDFFELASGRSLHPYEFLPSLKKHAFSGIRQYQLLQKKKDLVVLNIKPRDPDARMNFEQLKEEILGILGPGMKFDIVITNELETLPSGKIPTFGNQMKNPTPD